jgi:2-(3-amino-3-carboxypropyl)histidine synthase
LKVSGYELNLETVVKSINKNKFKKVLLQVPEGLKSYFIKFVDYIENNAEVNVIISADPCYGACDLPINNYENLGIELIVHIGHTSISVEEKNQIPVIFVNAESDLDISKVIQKAIPKIKGKTVGLVTTGQHVTKLDEVKKILIENNFKPVIGKGDSRIKLNGQILGCNFSSAKSIEDEVDTFLYIGSGNFHPLGLTLITNKQVIICDPYTNVVREKELADLKDMILRQRYGAIARSKDAQVFGIIIGTKIGQQRIDLAYEIKDKLAINKKKSYIISMNHFSPIYLEGLKEIDCFISTACPRIAMDDYVQYKVPIITPIELDILLDIKKWDDYQFDEILS